MKVFTHLLIEKNRQKNLAQQYLLRKGTTICLWTRNTEFVLFTLRAVLAIIRKFKNHKQIKRLNSRKMSKEKAKKYINSSIEVLNAMNWLISTQRTEAIIYLDKAIKELEEE